MNRYTDAQIRKAARETEDPEALMHVEARKAVDRANEAVRYAEAALERAKSAATAAENMLRVIEAIRDPANSNVERDGRIAREGK